MTRTTAIPPLLLCLLAPLLATKLHQRTPFSCQGGKRQRSKGRGFYLLVGWCWLCVLSVTVLAQRTTGSISGQVIADNGQPLPRAQVIITPAGADVAKLMGGMHRQLTDSEGRFQADGLEPAAYHIVAMAPGYVMADLENPLMLRAARIGDTVQLLMRKGGVITGTVTDAAGKPVTGMRVSAQSAGNATMVGGVRMLSLASGQSMQPRLTDDRGQYRIYGLLPGKYLVSANGATLMRTLGYAFEAQPPTFHPSATMDAATPVTVNSGAETTGVDIRFRGGAGFAVSGTLKGLAAGDGLMASTTTVQLKPANSDQLLATTVVLPFGGMNGFAFYGIPNGEYDLFARQVMMKDQSQQGSAPRRLKVSNADFTQLELTLSAMAGINGKLVLASDAAACRDARQSELDEIVLRLERASMPPKNASLAAMLGEAAQGYPNEQGVFRFTGLATGTFWLTLDWPDAHWYIKSLTAQRNAANLLATGFNLRTGEQLAVTTTLAANGARLSGKVAGNDKARSGAQLFLVPADESTNIYRYAETTAQADGGFQFDNAAPGKYWLLARPAAKPDEAPRQPLAWDATERAKLIKDATVANQAVELKACQVLKSYELKLP